MGLDFPAVVTILGVIYSYKIVIQLIGVVLAFSIRKVKIKGLNDSKEISIILYVTMIQLVIFSYLEVIITITCTNDALCPWYMTICSVSM